jgi:alpha-galactosidase
MTGYFCAATEVQLGSRIVFLQNPRMKSSFHLRFACALIGIFALCRTAIAQDSASADSSKSPEIRTPPAPHTPHINGPGIFGVRPEHPFLYHIPATGDRPMEFSVDNLPEGLKVDTRTGNITGAIEKAGDYIVTLRAKNSLGSNSKKFKIVVGETIDLTPAMGWNSWNHYAGRITQDIVLQTAKAMVDSGLINHGWTYVNIDDTWQGKRGGEFHGLQGNEKFPDIKGLCDQVHAMGLKFGIYSTPWETSYAGFPGGSSENPEGDWTKPTTKTIKNKNILPCAIAPYHFYTNDANQWAAWGVDYLKYDWSPIQFPETKEMYDALRDSGRDVIFSLSNNMNITNGPTCGKIANSWRTTGDIKANWTSMSSKGFGQDKWRKYSSPGHWNDPDMLEIATAERNQPGLTPDEEYTHMTLWCLICAPLLLANDLATMDAFTHNLLENDEVLAVSQDSLGDQAVAVASANELKVYAKKLEDGSKAVGLFNTSSNSVATVTVKWSDLGISGEQNVRDLWRQKDLGKFKDQFSMQVAPHGAELIKVGGAPQAVAAPAPAAPAMDLGPVRPAPARGAEQLMKPRAPAGQ